MIMKNHLFFMIIILFGISCHPSAHKKVSSDIPSLETQTLHLDSTDFDMCKQAECPRLDISYLDVREDDDVSQRINQRNKIELIDLFQQYQEEEIPTPTVRAAVAGFIREYLNFKQNYPTSVGVYEASIDQKILDQNQQTVVLETQFHFYTGGAHGIYGTHYHNFDAKTGRLLSLTDLISDIPALTAYAEKEFRKKHEVPAGDRLTDHGFFFQNDEYILPENIAVTSKEVILLYNPYEAASYAQGQIQLDLPIKQVRQWLVHPELNSSHAKP